MVTSFQICWSDHLVRKEVQSSSVSSITPLLRRWVSYCTLVCACRWFVSSFLRVQREVEITGGHTMWRHPAKKCLNTPSLTHIQTSCLGGRCKRNTQHTEMEGVCAPTFILCWTMVFYLSSPTFLLMIVTTVDILTILIEIADLFLKFLVSMTFCMAGPTV